ncbi:MAG TPA: lipoyl(octanoyl) transferase LipB [Gemmatimonadales bacterium]|jgi:lipoate-protein ligase B|nr:lipoyl(octanoyl) transferase LipB [Gemmatimonadales bacterium]
MTAPLAVVDLGRRPYGEVLELQRLLCRRRVSGELPDDVLLLVEHEPVITLGRGTRASSLPIPLPALEARGLEVFLVERGGDVTLHAPGQLVGYPILDLTGWRRDLHWYLRQLEESLIRGLARLAIPAGRNPGRTGVWTRERKIASIGIHVKQWVTMHGFALNVTTELSLFDLIVPCGISGVTMTSVARERPAPAVPLPSPASGQGLWAETRGAIVAAFGEVFERAPEGRAEASLGAARTAARNPGGPGIVSEA